MHNYKAAYHQIIAATPITMNDFAMGLTLGWTAPTIKKLLDSTTGEIHPTPDECSWIASLAQFGAALGPLFSISLLDTLGRKLMIQLGAATLFLMWLSILLTRSILIICTARLLLGVAEGVCVTTSSIYLGEICSPKIRGILCCVSATGFCMATLSEYILATYLSYNATISVNFVLTFVCFVSTFLLIESPQYLLLRDRHEKAEKNLMWLKGTSSMMTISTEFEEIKSNVASEKIKKHSYKELLLARANRRSVNMMLILHILWAASGYIPISTYSTIIFPSTQLLTSYQFTIFFGVIQLLSTVIAVLVIEKYNRRTLTLISYSVITVSNIVVAFLFYDDVTFSKTKYTPWIIFFFVCTNACSSVMMYSMLSALRAEIFPQSVRPFGSGLCVMAISCTGFVTVKIFLTVVDAYGIYVNFVTYAVVSFTALCYSYLNLPETRGKTLIDIQRSLEYLLAK